MTTTTRTYDLDEIRRSIRLLFQPGEIVELRAPKVLGKVTHGGYFNDHDRLATEATKLSGKATGIYVVLNPINPDLLARSANRVTINPQHLTQDSEITDRHFLPIDIDSNRPPGISATDEEHEAALHAAAAVKAYLWGLEFPPESIIVGDSGNGAHVLVRIDLPNDADSKSLIGRCLKATAAKFDSKNVHIDQGVGNAARIWKLPGTLSCKGSSIPERPHRLARIINAPESLVVAPREALEKLAATLPPEEAPKTNTPFSSQPFDIESWLAKHEIPVRTIKPYKAGTKYILQHCVFNHDHTDSDAAIFHYPDGVLGYRCLHNSCSDKHWTDVRKLYEPDFDMRKEYVNFGKQTFQGWRWGNFGLFLRNDKGAETLVLGIPLSPVEILTTPEHRQILHLELTVNGTQRDVFLDDLWVGKRGTDAAHELAEYGIAITSKEVSPLQQFVAEVLRSNVFAQRGAYRRLGWYNDMLCVPGLCRNVFIPTPGFEWFDGYQTAPCDEEAAAAAWQRVNELGRYNPAIYVVEGVALGGPSLKALPRTLYISFTTHLHAPGTGTGKTSLIDMAAACCGNPASLVRAWDSTKVGAEVLLGTVRNMTLFLNELGDSKSGTPNDVVMMLPEEKGRARGSSGGGLRTTYEWRTLILSTGNAPIAPGSAHHARRVISVPIGMTNESATTEIQQISRTYFGWPLKWCAPLYKTPKIKDRLDEITHCYENFYQGELAPLKPQARSWAVIELGARMLLAVLGMDEEEAHRGVLRVAELSVLRRQSEGINYLERLLNIVREAVSRDPAGFGAAANPTEKPHRGNLGKVFYDAGEGNDWTGVAILPSVLRELTQHSAIPDLTGVLIEARDLGILKTSQDKRRLEKQVRIKGNQVYCYVFDYSTGKDADGGDVSGDTSGDIFERENQPCHHQSVFVTTCNHLKISPLRARTGNIVVTGGDVVTGKENESKNNKKTVTTTVTTGGDSPSKDSNGSVEL